MVFKSTYIWWYNLVYNLDNLNDNEVFSLKRLKLLSLRNSYIQILLWSRLSVGVGVCFLVSYKIMQIVVIAFDDKIELKFFCVEFFNF